MPTPSSTIPRVDDTRSSHLSCPPDEYRWMFRRLQEQNDEGDDDETLAVASEPNTDSLPLAHTTDTTETRSTIIEHRKEMRVDDEDPSSQTDILTPMSTGSEDKHVESDRDHRHIIGEMGTPSPTNDFSNIRLKPSSPSSFLRSGSRFHGTQQSERQVYEVQVEIKHVDMNESFLCGYLRIQGLTEDHPTLTTYFEGEIIGSKYSFLTQHEDWGSTDKVDLQHWAKFSAFRPYQKQAKKGDLYIPDLAQKENIFMRWKEHFLVPDHRVRTINGASFEGFYYICFNQIKGSINGIYFHAKSEKFQQLDLKHVPVRGCFGAMEFR